MYPNGEQRKKVFISASHTDRGSYHTVFYLCLNLYNIKIRSCLFLYYKPKLPIYALISMSISNVIYQNIACITCQVGCLSVCIKFFYLFVTKNMFLVNIKVNFIKFTTL